MMKRLRIWAAVAGLMAVVACGSDTNDTTSEDEQADETTETARAEGLDICGLVSEETLAPLRGEFDVDREPRPQSLTEAHTFLGCQAGFWSNDPHIAWGVRDPEALTNPAVDELLADYAEGGEITEIEIDGAPARLAEGIHPRTSTDYARFRVAMEIDGLEVLVDGNAFDPDEGHDVDAARDLVVAVAAEVAAGMDGTAPTRIDLHDFCPDADDPLIIEAMEGDVVVAHSFDHGPDDGSLEYWRCEYINEYSVIEVSRSLRQPDATEREPSEPNFDQDVEEVRGYPADLNGRGMDGEFTVDGDCRYQVRLDAVYPYDPFAEIDLFPSEEDMDGWEVADAREPRLIAALEATYDATPCAD